MEAGEQAFSLNALFVPGERARFLVDLEADRLDLTPFMDVAPETSQTEAPAADTAKPANLQFLAGFDADMSINAAALTLGEISASDVSFSAALRTGNWLPSSGIWRSMPAALPPTSRPTSRPTNRPSGAASRAKGSTSPSSQPSPAKPSRFREH